MNESQGEVLEISFPKAALYSAGSMVCFLVATIVMGLPLHDPVLIGFLVVMVPGMTFVFAGCCCSMLRCRITPAGLCTSFPLQRIIRWEEITKIRKSWGSPFYMVRCGGFFGQFCVLPRPVLLKRPENLKELIERYAPPGNIARKVLAA